MQEKKSENTKIYYIFKFLCQGMITTIFKNDNMFSDGCTNETGIIDCTQRDQDFNDIYFISLLCMNIGAFVFGVLGDKFGSVSIRITAFIFALIGYTLLMFIEETESLIWISMPRDGR
jgi:Na+/melibiose symporter-like transporter